MLLGEWYGYCSEFGCILLHIKVHSNMQVLELTQQHRRSLCIEYSVLTVLHM